MKRISVYLLSLIMSGALFVACSDDDDDQLTFDKNSVEVMIDDEDVVKVNGGVSPFKAVPANEEIVEVALNGRDITIKGLKEGSTTIKVTDNNGLDAAIAVTVTKDPYEEEKEDATVRINWNEYEKVLGVDEGIYTFIKSEEKIATFSWTNEEGDESLVLALNDPQDKIGGEAEVDETRESLATPVGKLTITVEGEDDPVEYDVTSWRLVQAQPANDEEGTPDTYWIAFTADAKNGLVVAPFMAAAE